MTPAQMDQRIKELEREREKFMKVVEVAKKLNDYDDIINSCPYWKDLEKALDDLVDPWVKQPKMREEKE